MSIAAARAKPGANSAAKQKEPKAPLPKSLIQALPVAIKLMEHINAINALIPQLDKDLHAARVAGPVPLARAYVVLHRLLERLGEALKPLVDEEKGLAAKYKREFIPFDFDMSGIPNIPLDEGFRVGISHTLRASIKQGMRDEAFQWLREHQLPDLISSTVNASSLSSAAKELLETNWDLPEELFNVAMMPTTSVTRVK